VGHEVKDHAGYVQRVRENTRRYVEEILAENERLMQRVSSLEGERCALEGRLIATQTKLDHQLSEEEKLKQRFEDMESEQQRFFEGYAKIEQQNNNLASLYVATYGLHGSMDRQEVLLVIQEIVANLIGSEEMAVFELDASGEELRLVSSTGIEPSDFERIPLGSGRIGRAAGSGETCLVDAQDPQDGEGALPQEATLTACVPFKIDGQVTGALAVFRLLGQKPGLEPLDFELFDLLGSQAATALHTTRMHEQLHGEQTESG
jgi:nitrate/nitrite-specific signal transduction histidine kinase